MSLEVVSPEAILFQGDVESVAVPGISGAFHILNNHAPIVSVLGRGNVTIYGNISLEEKFQDKFTTTANGNTALGIDSGVVEMRDNKLVVLVD